MTKNSHLHQFDLTFQSQIKGWKLFLRLDHYLTAPSAGESWTVQGLAAHHRRIYSIFTHSNLLSLSYLSFFGPFLPPCSFSIYVLWVWSSFCYWSFTDLATSYLLQLQMRIQSRGTMLSLRRNSSRHVKRSWQRSTPSTLVMSKISTTYTVTTEVKITHWVVFIILWRLCVFLIIFVTVHLFPSEKLAEAQRRFATLQNELQSSLDAQRESWANGRARRRRKTVFALSQQERCKHRNIKDLQLAFSEFYLSLILLQNYQVHSRINVISTGNMQTGLIQLDSFSI